MNNDWMMNQPGEPQIYIQDHQMSSRPYDHLSVVKLRKCDNIVKSALLISDNDM